MIHYRTNAELSVEQFKGLMESSTLAERRPVEDLDCLKGMLAHSNLVVSAWCGDELVGIARSITDFHYCCYLSDLAVDANYQRQGIGKELIAITQQALELRCKIILLAAPAANAYYENIGFRHHSRCWTLERNSPVPR